ncbi:phospholipase domain-containing protein [Actinomadura adrarensis]|uniref:Phospholipase domain-containing protein n=1 Tax=Actinomadura adrarensis TaxID=1819600 RepID=A0ABW3CL70_9ACTN
MAYQPEASATPGGGRRLRIEMSNGGEASVHFALYPYGGELAKPRHFDVARKAQDEIALRGDGYDLVLIGPNGFRREFAGSVNDTAQVASAPGPDRKNLGITLRNTGDRTLTFTLTALAYGGRTRQVTVPAGQRRTVHWHTRQGWYDVEVRVAEDASFRRRLMGHIENGKASVTG